MKTRSPLRSAFAWSRLRWTTWGGLVLVAGLFLWFSGLPADLWHAPVVSLSDPPTVQVVPSPKRAMVLSPQSKPTTGIMRFLPAISVAPPLVARVPESPPLLLPDPRQDVPSSLARSVQDQARPRPPSRSGPDVSPPALAVGTLADAPAIPSTTGVGGGGDLFTAPLEQSPTALPPAADEARRWLWPVHGKISQSFSSAHRAIDVVSGHGALVVAADGGEVVYAEWEISGYGYLVIVDHGDGYRTYYGHLYGFYVDVGQRVERGDLLGELGNTGRSTGPHLHFEIRYRDIPRDPLGLLPSDPPVGRDDPATGQP